MEGGRDVIILYIVVNYGINITDSITLSNTLSISNWKTVRITRETMKKVFPRQTAESEV